MSFKIRTTKPGKGNKYYIRKANGGYSNAIKGNPTDAECNVLSNCVGYAYGRFNEIGGYGCCKYLAPVNAENFMDYKGSCKTGSTPKAGAVMVWQGIGSLAGHVAFVEKVNNSTQVYTSESDYGGKPFFNKTRNKGSNGNWGLSTTNYKFLGFIYNPAVKEETAKLTTTTTSNATSTTFKKGDKIVLNGYLYRDSMGNGKGAYKTNYKGTITIVNAKGSKPYHIDSIGWVAAADIKKQTTTTTNTKKGTLTVNPGSWNVRKGAGMNYAVVKVVKGGTKLNYYGTSNGWYKIDSGYIGPKAVKVN